MSRRLATVGAMVWTLVVTILRADRLPNEFAREHWFIDYRFGFVKRGLVGSVVSLATRLARVDATKGLIDVLSIGCFLVFCLVLLALGLRLIRRSGWSTTVTLAVLVFFSSPFMVMSAHLIGYYDNLCAVLAVLSLALLLRGWMWTAVLVQVLSILVHENALLVGFPVFCWLWWLETRTDSRQSARGVQLLWPLGLPVVAFLMLAVSQGFAPRGVEQSLTAHLATYPFIAGRLADVRVPHWITITFYDSYVLHRGLFLGRLLSQAMIGLVLPSILPMLGIIVEANEIGALSMDSAALLTVCAAPQIMHVMAWDTARIWTYSILNAFLLLWVYVEVSVRRRPSPFVTLLCLLGLFLNAIEVTPLMDGLSDHLDVTMRLLLYAPPFAVASGLVWVDRRGGDFTAPGSPQPLGQPLVTASP